MDECIGIKIIDNVYRYKKELEKLNIKEDKMDLVWFNTLEILNNNINRSVEILRHRPQAVLAAGLRLIIIKKFKISHFDTSLINLLL